jgi:outer membrane protein assembly factor BamB
VRPALATLAALFAAGCGSPGVGVGAAGDPLDPGRDRAIGLPVMSFLWKRVVHARRGEHRPQEFAAPVATPQGEAVFVGSLGGDLYRLRAGDGAVQWRSKLGATSAGPLLASRRLFVGTDDGAMVAVDPDYGTPRWRFTSKGAILQPAVVVGDMLIFANDADHVYALDADSGKWRWQYERETPEEFTMRGHAGVAVDGDRVIAGFADGHLVALTAQAGEVVWVRSLAGASTAFVDVDSTPAVAGGALYAASTSGGLYALDPSDGTEKWRVDVKGAGPVTVDGPRLYFAAADEGLFALDRSGHVLWRQGIRRGGDPARPIIDGEYLYLSLADRGLHVVDKRSGELLQWFDPGPGVSSEPAVAGERLYFLSNGGILYAMGLRRF